MNSEQLPLWIWILVAMLLLAQGMWIFQNARKRGKGMSAWFWGIWGLINFPTPLLVYLLVVVLPEYRRTKKGGKPPV
ncbi:hypothetical protein [Paenibacillus vini]|uniref:SigmaY antisigma factor component n=1 Tax=Paenibacillus vini TaxID=1476024 RepID=A0ABQ4MFB8_9BACL|nr:hypothetical protein [Paenibacillus vini]GIP54624.1 hypothetical protein J42TS3_36590 [Paenibacillus vini]